MVTAHCSRGPADTPTVLAGSPVAAPVQLLSVIEPPEIRSGIRPNSGIAAGLAPAAPCSGHFSGTRTVRLQSAACRPAEVLRVEDSHSQTLRSNRPTDSNCRRRSRRARNSTNTSSSHKGAWPETDRTPATPTRRSGRTIHRIGLRSHRGTHSRRESHRSGRREIQTHRRGPLHRAHSPGRQQPAPQ